MRFSQYFDEETHLHENWNRFYDPVHGGYTSFDPLLSVLVAPYSVENVSTVGPVGVIGGPRWLADSARQGTTMPAYSYAMNNPLHWVDEDGFVQEKSGPGFGNQQPMTPAPSCGPPMPPPPPPDQKQERCRNECNVRHIRCVDPHIYPPLSEQECDRRKVQCYDRCARGGGAYPPRLVSP